jgi:hypothetical protein
MLLRYAAASVVVTVVLGLAGLAVLLVVSVAPEVTLERFAPVLILWCVVPVVWGLWAMLTPRTWFPERLPLWGAILGVVAASLAMFVANLPSRMRGEPVPAEWRGAGVAVLVVVYYLLWILVRRVYRTLAAPAIPK